MTPPFNVQMRRRYLPGRRLRFGSWMKIRALLFAVTNSGSMFVGRPFWPITWAAIGFLGVGRPDRGRRPLSGMEASWANASLVASTSSRMKLIAVVGRVRSGIRELGGGGGAFFSFNFSRSNSTVMPSSDVNTWSFLGAETTASLGVGTIRGRPWKRASAANMPAMMATAIAPLMMVRRPYLPNSRCTTKNRPLEFCLGSIPVSPDFFFHCMPPERHAMKFYHLIRRVLSPTLRACSFCAAVAIQDQLFSLRGQGVF